MNTGTSNGCQNTLETQVCASTISSAISSLNALYASSACSATSSLKPDQISARKSFIDQYTQYQSNLNLKNPTCKIIENEYIIFISLITFRYCWSTTRSINLWILYSSRGSIILSTKRK